MTLQGRKSRSSECMPCMHEHTFEAEDWMPHDMSKEPT